MVSTFYHSPPHLMQHIFPIQFSSSSRNPPPASFILFSTSYRYPSKPTKPPYPPLYRTTKASQLPPIPLHPAPLPLSYDTIEPASIRTEDMRLKRQAIGHVLEKVSRWIVAELGVSPLEPDWYHVANPPHPRFPTYMSSPHTACIP